MNFIQKDPNDPRYAEFHNGEYEFWPMSGSVKSKSISIPAAVVSGLELLAAAAAAGLLAIAVSAMYVTSSARSIDHHSAVINASVYNNASDEAVDYALSLFSRPEDILQEGTLEDEASTLVLHGLRSGTTYLLQYYDADDKEIGEFRFTTPGDPAAGDPHSPETDLPQKPADSPVTQAQDPAKPAEEPTESTTEPTEETTEPTEETTEPTEETEPPVVVVRPTPNTPDYPDTPANDPVPDTPTPAPVPEDEPPTAGEPTLKATVHSPESGNVDDVYFTCSQTFTFRNVSSNYRVRVRQGSTNITNYTAKRTGNTLTVTVSGVDVDLGESVTTTVTVTTDAGSVSKSQKIAPPSLDSVSLTAEKLDGGGYIFHITANVSPDDADEMACSAALSFNGGEDIPVELRRVSNSLYTGSYTAADLTGSGLADVYVYGTWQKYTQTETISELLEYGP